MKEEWGSGRARFHVPEVSGTAQLITLIVQHRPEGSSAGRCANPAFSGLNAFRAIILITKAQSRLDVPKTAHLLGQEWDKILAGQNCLSHYSPVPLFGFRSYMAGKSFCGDG